MTRTILGTIATAFLIACAPADSDYEASIDDARARTKGPPDRDDTIADIASSAEDFTILTAALDAAGLVGFFDGRGQYTVFAPTDDAFIDALEALDISAEALLSDTDTLTSVLLYHVARGDRDSSDVVSSEQIRMLDGNFADIWVDETGAYIDDSQIIITDIEASNGVIHAIDAVLLPPDFF
jgi:transforming growth factor-beta-induced protein